VELETLNLVGRLTVASKC